MNISEIDENELPNGWVKSLLNQVCHIEMGQSPPSESYNVTGDGLPFFQGKSEFTELYPLPRKWCTSPTKLAKPNDVLLSVRAPVGSTNLAPSICAIGRGLAALSAYEGIENRYILYAMRFWSQDLVKKATGTTFEAVTSSTVNNFPLLIASTNEQKRIVAKIEELFSKLDAGIAALERVQANLKRYRAALLKAAVEGKLTEEWRKQNPNTEPASKLLQCILKERRQKWESEQLEKYQKSGRIPPKDWQSKYKEPSAPDTANLPSLPDGWCWASLGQLTWSIKDGPHYSPSYVKEGIPFITGGNVRPSGVDFDSAKRISIELHQELSQRCCPEKGDILYTKGGTTGIARVNTYDIDFNVWVHVAVLKLMQLIDPFYIQHVLNSPFCYAQSQQYTHGVGNQDLGLTRMVNIVLSLPPSNEQVEVVKQIDEAMGMIDHLEIILNNDLKRASRLRQSILKQAFSGKLVPQDSNDEPASVLLQRIKNIRKQENTQTRVKSTMNTKSKLQSKEPKVKRSIYETLLEANNSLSPQELFTSAGFGNDTEEVEEFYEELRTEINDEKIIEERHGDERVTLQAKKV